MESQRLLEIAERLQALCIERDITVAVAESLTGGLIGATLTSVSGASEYFQGGVISYSVDIKKRILGVDPSIIETYGVVSRECAIAMAQGVQELCDTRASLAVTGEAGPGVGEKGVPVGTVWVAVCLDDVTISQAFSFDGDRHTIREQTVADTISLLSEVILTHPCGTV